MKIRTRGGHVKLTKFSISNPKPDLCNINAHAKIGENPLTFHQIIVRNRRKYDNVAGR